MSGKRMDRFERQTIRVNRRYARTIGDQFTIKSLTAAKQGRIVYE